MRDTTRSRGGARHGCWAGRWLWAARLSMRASAIALVWLAGATFLRAQATPSIEYQVKAAFLFNFAKFVEWPPDAFTSEKTPITLCVFRQDPFGSALEEIIRGKTINNRELAARRISELTELKGCQIVFVSGKEDKLLPEILNGVKGASVLVAGESANFAERGGAVQFFLENNKLRFAINVDAVQRTRLQVSSKLLALARIAHDDDHAKGN